MFYVTFPAVRPTISNIPVTYRLSSYVFHLSDTSIHTRRSRNALSVYQEPNAVSDGSLFVQTSHLFVSNKRITCVAVEL